MDLNPVAARISEVLGIKVEDIWAKGRYRRTAEAHSLLCYWMVRELGVFMSSLGAMVGISIPSLSDSVTRVHMTAGEKELGLIKY